LLYVKTIYAKHVISHACSSTAEFADSLAFLLSLSFHEKMKRGPKEEQGKTSVSSLQQHGDVFINHGKKWARDPKSSVNMI
jgi:hypothetical protein